VSLQTIQVHLEPISRSYDVIIGAGALPAALDALSELCPRNILPVITDETVAGLHLQTLTSSLSERGIELVALILPPGETQKSFAGLERICNFLLEQNVERGDCVAAFGGGVIGDVTGLACALTKRGTGFVQIPTTLLAQIDSSVGGKTAINTKIGKNMVGAFYQPKLVVADLDFLQTLQARQWRAGYAEMIKMACLSDAGFFDALEAAGPELLSGQSDDLAEHLARSVQGKADIVAADELEHGQRALLNLGHTFGHALESEAPGKILHGEAVAAGMDAAFGLSVELGMCSHQDRMRVRQHLQAMGLPGSLIEAPGGPYSAKNLLARMKDDKKNQGGKIGLVLCDGIGRALVRSDISETRILTYLEKEIRS
jgi:3-dehydroquinate synthase